MTKLEAWQAWCATAGTERLADQFTLENSSHGKAFSFAWGAAHEACAKVCDETLAQHYMKQTIPARDESLLLAACADCAAAIRARGETK